MKKGYQDLSEEKINLRTGKSFDDWINILDKFNVKEKGHISSARYLKEKYNLGGWWPQVIVVKYEYDRKLRK